MELIKDLLDQNNLVFVTEKNALSLYTSLIIIYQKQKI